jgi:hypothetical protein
VPNPQVPIFSDAGITPIIQPIIADGFGHYDFYVLPGLYTVAIYYGGQLQQYYVDQSIGNVGSSAGTSILLATNGTPNFNQTVLNVIQGAGMLVNTDNLGNMTITNLNPTPYVPPSPTPRVSAIYYTIDGGGAVVTTGIKGQLNIPLNCTITGWVITADQSGSAVVDVLSSSYANFPSTASITGGDNPTLSSAQANENLSVSAWDAAVLAGTQIQFSVASATTVQRLNITLNITIP